MQADEIIQQKEWQQLNTDEKQILKELAENEQEYNLLKQLLTVSENTAEQVPEINPGLKFLLQKEVQKNKKNNLRILQYAAAAIFIAVIFSVLILKYPAERTEPGTASGIKIITAEKKPVRAEKSLLPAENIKIPGPAAVKKRNRKKTNLISPGRFKIPDGQDQNIYTAGVTVSAKLSDNEPLLSLITEVY